ncbi:MAG: hypothetical protein GWN00_15410 [Aliifodinibius sp.]|nr:hypothetical protein [Fodinibius sp.]NIV15570.1 hypothetical protein [Fodinibius sp.]NIY26140.1 hypothetical protein [Fodinibius sp.]
MQSLNELQVIFSTPWLRSIYYPKSFYLKGKIYEKKGNINLAIKNYENFLELWKNADKDLPDLMDAKKRYEALKENSTS